jgi:hypothetical protein
MPRTRLLLLLTLALPALLPAQAIDRDLLEVTMPQLETMYAAHRYTVTQVVEWYLARIVKYDGVYRAVETVDRQGAVATAAREDAGAAKALSVAPCGACPSSSRPTPASKD